MDFLLKHRFFRRECTIYTSWTFQKACAHNCHVFLQELGNQKSIKRLQEWELHDILLDACRRGYLPVVKYLIECKKAPTSTVDEDTCYYGGYYDDFISLNSVEDCYTHCARYAQLEIMKYLDDNPNLEKYEGCAMEWAIKCGHIDIVKYLVEKHGARAFTDECFYAEDLHSSYYHNQYDILWYLWNIKNIFQSNTEKILHMCLFEETCKKIENIISLYKETNN